MKLALFDLDQTLLDGDTDTLWFQYLVRKNHIESGCLKRLEDYFKDYHQGVLDYSEYMDFILLPLKEFELEEVQSWRNLFLDEEIRPRIRFQHLLEEHSKQDHTLVLITATHDFLAEPIGQMLEMDFTLSTCPEVLGGRYTGKVTQFCFREGKVKMLKKFLKFNGEEADEIWFYSDSFNDISLLEYSDHPIVVGPDEKLRKLAKKFGWSILL